MASEVPQDRSLDTALTASSTTSADAPGETIMPSVWRTDLQWVALAWLGGLIIGGFLLLIAFTSESHARTTAALAGGGTFLAIFPGLCATLQTWQGHRRSMGKGSIWPWDREC